MTFKANLKEIIKSRLSPSAVGRVKRVADLFISYKRNSYSQYGEDLFLAEYFKDKSSGFFVDVGAYHPTQFSNTYLLYQKGWRGINIDANPDSMKLFKALRVQDINIEALISDKKETMTFASWGLNSDNSAHAGQIEGVQRQFQRSPDLYQMQTRSLTEVLDHEAKALTDIDLLSVDVEGMDVSVLLSLDWTRYRPRIVIVETYSPNIDEVMSTDLYDLLKSKGYNLISWYYRSLIFERVS